MRYRVEIDIERDGPLTEDELAEAHSLVGVDEGGERGKIVAVRIEAAPMPSDAGKSCVHRVRLDLSCPWCSGTKAAASNASHAAIGAGGSDENDGAQCRSTNPEDGLRCVYGIDHRLDRHCDALGRHWPDTPSSCLACGNTRGNFVRGLCHDLHACNAREQKLAGPDGWRRSSPFTSSAPEKK